MAGMEPENFRGTVAMHFAPVSADREHSPQEIEARVVNGWMALLIVSALLVFGYCFVIGSLPRFDPQPLVTGLVLLGVGVYCVRGFFTCEPNHAVVMLFLGSYAGTARSSGFHWANPLYLRIRVSLRAQTLTTAILKVNDERGHPIEIAAVLMWKLNDTARAVFEVEDCAQFIRVKSELALRELAARHAYDNADEMLVPARYKTLRGDIDQIAAMLREAVQSDVSAAGILVEEAKIAHLAYAPEIAQSMLRRQQAEAVIAARRKLVEGAVSMVEMALIDIGEKSLITFTPAQRVALVTSLMTVLVRDTQAPPARAPSAVEA